MSMSATGTEPASGGEDRAGDALIALVARAAEGDRAAETAVCARFASAVRLFARRRLRAHDAVEEFGQDVMLALVEALRAGTIEEPQRLGGFVLGICRNLARDRARQNERREELWQRHGVTLESMAVAPPEPASYEFLHLEDCLSQLPKRSRDLVRLAYIEAREADDIATHMGTTAVNVRVMRHRTLHTLRDCMSKRISWEAVA
jgi:RNA polymerase sigma-70 factor (ECF subfamily)